MLMGEYHHNIDEKGRLVIPTNFRKDIGESFVIAKGLEKCLYIYPMNKWEKLVSKLDELSFTKKDVRTFTRTFYSGATASEFDNNGRINITSSLTHYAGLTKKCVIIGVNDRLEIWDEDEFERMLEQSSNEIENIAESLFE